MSIFQLTQLPYSSQALEPVISSKTIEFHYGKHHMAYVNNLNNLLKGTALEKASIEEIILKEEGGIFNNAAQIWNHTFYWECLRAPLNSNIPTGDLALAIDKNFESFDNFKQKFSHAAATLFGSGWVWLVTDGKKLDIIQESNAGNPLTKSLKPLLTIDVWEHAYYIDYQNRRADYINNFWSIVNWDTVNNNL